MRRIRMGVLLKETNDHLILLLSLQYLATNFSMNLFILLFYLLDDSVIQYSIKLEHQALYTNTGIGRGRVKTKRKQYTPIDVYDNWLKNTKMFDNVIHINHHLFKFICDGIKELMKGTEHKFCMSYENMIILSLIFVVGYPTTFQLCVMFGVSSSVVSRILDYILPFMVQYFVQYIPDCRISDTHSCIDRNLKFIIDNTIHKTHKPSVDQSLDYNGHYRMHGRQTQILLDFDGNVISYLTNIRGKIHDALVAVHNTHFIDIIGTKFALGDPGFKGVGYVISGFNSCEVKTTSQKIFDKITRSEQVLIENVNKFLKDCRSINKQDSFRHGEGRLVACVSISIGLYNLKKMNGYFDRVE